MSEKILEVEHHPGEGLVVRIRPPRVAFIDEATREHLWIAKKEMLLALRGIIDAAIQHTENQEKAKGKGRKKIEVQ